MNSKAQINHLAFHLGRKNVSVAVAREEAGQWKVVANQSEESTGRHAERISLLIGRVLEESNAPNTPLGSILIARGPGSFTSLRVAFATAKAIAHANSCRVGSVHSAEVLAAREHSKFQDSRLAIRTPITKDRTVESVFEKAGDGTIRLVSENTVETLSEMTGACLYAEGSAPEERSLPMTAEDILRSINQTTSWEYAESLTELSEWSPKYFADERFA